MEDEQSAVRARAVRNSRASVELEGGVLPAACDELDHRYIAGELSDAQHTAGYLWIAGDRPEFSSLEDALRAVARRRYTAAELIAQCDPSAPPPADLALWDEAKPQGKELW